MNHAFSMVFCLLLAGSGLITSSARGQDLVDLFFDTAGTVNCQPSGTGQVWHAYLLVKNCSAESGIIAWQGSLAIDQTVYLLSATVRGSAVNVGAGHDYVVGLSEPIQHSQVMILADFDVVTFSGGNVSFCALEAGAFGTPMFIAADAPDILVPMYPEFGGNGQASLAIGTPECPQANNTGGVAAEISSSWGGLKLLFR